MNEMKDAKSKLAIEIFNAINKYKKHLSQEDLIIVLDLIKKDFESNVHGHI